MCVSAFDQLDGDRASSLVVEFCADELPFLAAKDELCDRALAELKPFFELAGRHDDARFERS